MAGQPFPKVIIANSTDDATFEQKLYTPHSYRQYPGNLMEGVQLMEEGSGRRFRNRYFKATDLDIRDGGKVNESGKSEKTRITKKKTRNNCKEINNRTGLEIFSKELLYPGKWW